jgi:hypothetical protein
MIWGKLLGALLLGWGECQQTCPTDLEVRCIADINLAYADCEQAAKEKGRDVPVDLECVKFLGKVEKDCWPCVCQVARQNHWKISGCVPAQN